MGQRASNPDSEEVTLEVPGEGVEAPETPENPAGDHEDTETPENPAEGHTDPDTGEPETFPRAYVEKLRRESADHRARAKRADELAAALWTARVAGTGRLADPTDLPMPDDVDPLDADAVATAVDELLGRKPHLASRVPRGDAGQGVKDEPKGFSLSEMIRAAV